MRPGLESPSGGANKGGVSCCPPSGQHTSPENCVTANTRRGTGYRPRPETVLVGLCADSASASEPPADKNPAFRRWPASGRSAPCLHASIRVVARVWACAPQSEPPRGVLAWEAARVLLQGANTQLRFRGIQGNVIDHATTGTSGSSRAPTHSQQSDRDATPTAAIAEQRSAVVLLAATPSACHFASHKSLAQVGRAALHTPMPPVISSHV
jgi:hypothetical protein